MTAALRFVRENTLYLPFLILMAGSVFLSTSPHRALFYVLAPWLIYTLYKRRAEFAPYLRTVSFAALAAYIVYFTSSLLWSDAPEMVEPHRIIRNAACVLVFTSAFVYVLANPPAWDVRKAAMIFGALAAVIAIIALVCFYDEGRTFARQRLHAFGRYTSPNHLAILLGLAALMLFAVPAERVKRAAFLRYALAGLLVVFVLLTGSRSAMAGLVACAGLLFVSGRIKFAAILSATLVAALALSVSIAGLSIDRMIERGDGFRLAIWSEAWDGIKQKPVLGHGVAVEPSFTTLNNNETAGWESTHNAYVGHLYSGGAIGLAIYLFLIGNMAFQIAAACLSRHRAGGGSLFMPHFAALLGCFGLSVSLFSFSHHLNHMNINWLVVWVPFAMAWALEVRRKNLRVDHRA